jgi:pimeloyl-ACP methyl ester carboxylesterase
MTACARIVAQRIGAALLSVPGAAHEPHREQPAVVNTALRELWNRADAVGAIRSR